MPHVVFGKARETPLWKPSALQVDLDRFWPVARLSYEAIRNNPNPAKPMPSIAQVEDSGTEGAKAVMVALPVLNPAVKKPDENRVAFVSITNSAVSESLGTPSKKLKPTVAAVGRSTVLGGTPVKSVK